jgi:GNAT superfamily N-acetyltransferase
MPWTLTDDVAAYAGAVHDLMTEDPVRCTVLASVLAGLVRHGPAAYGAEPPVLAWWSAEGPAAGEVRAAALRTPPYGLNVSSLPDQAADELAAKIAAVRGTALNAVIGDEASGTAFAAAWSAATGASSYLGRRMRLYRLGTLVPLDPAPAGTARVATAEDATVAYAWHDAFAAETGQRSAARAIIDSQLGNGQLVLWETKDGPAAIASLTPVLTGVARVGQVYSPPATRGRGHGGAVTVAASRLAWERGAREVLLFTDLANPISNGLYLRLGYRPVEDRVEIGFELR